MPPYGSVVAGSRSRRLLLRLVVYVSWKARNALDARGVWAEAMNRGQDVSCCISVAAGACCGVTNAIYMSTTSTTALEAIFAFFPRSRKVSTAAAEGAVQAHSSSSIGATPVLFSVTPVRTSSATCCRGLNTCGGMLFLVRECYECYYYYCCCVVRTSHCCCLLSLLLLFCDVLVPIAAVVQVRTLLFALVRVARRAFVTVLGKDDCMTCM